jgi:EmrB/QacA subfamily drug resistance transporter
MFGLEISSVPVILPTLERVLRATFNDLQWIMNAYTIACTTVLMATGTLADRFGRRRVFLLSIASFGLTSLLCGLASTTWVLIAGRLLQGMSGGAMLICQVAILSHQFREGRERARAFSAWGIVFGIGLGFGPVIGGAIVALANWQWIFLVHVAIAAVTLILVGCGVVESRDPSSSKLDTVGIVTLSASAFCLTYFITQGTETGFSSPVALGSLAIAVLSLVAFVHTERRHPYPMFDFSVFSIRNFTGALLGSVAMNMSFWPLMIYLPIYFQRALGYDAVTAGCALLAYTLPTLIFPPVGERLTLRLQARTVIPFGLSLIGLGFMLMFVGSRQTDASWLTMLPGCLLAGAGLGITNTPVTNTTTGSVPSARAGMASGIDMSARMISLAINIAMMGFLLVHGTASYLEKALNATADASAARRIAESVAAGNFESATQTLSAFPHAGEPGALIQQALVQGFGVVFLYGGVGVIVLACASFLVFRWNRPQAHEGVHVGDRSELLGLRQRREANAEAEAD